MNIFHVRGKFIVNSSIQLKSFLCLYNNNSDNNTIPYYT